MIEGRHGFNSENAFLIVEKHIPTGPMQTRTEELANFSLRYLPDTNEVVLSRGDEIVYSELLDDGEPLDLMKASKRDLIARAISHKADPRWARSVTKAQLREFIIKGDRNGR